MCSVCKANRAREMLNSYPMRNGEEPGNEFFEETIIDAVTDFLHLATFIGHDIDRITRLAKQHVEAELDPKEEVPCD